MFFSVAALAALAAASIVIAARRPGGCRTYDVLFPLLLLNPSHATNVLWSWQVQLVLSTVIAGFAILLIVSRAGWPSPVTAAAVGVCLALLALCGANGVALVPAFACWLLAASLAHWNSETGRMAAQGVRRVHHGGLCCFPCNLLLQGLSSPQDSIRPRRSLMPCS